MSKFVVTQIDNDNIERSHINNLGQFRSHCNVNEHKYYFYFTYYLLNTFRTLICPSSGACDCVEGLSHRLSCSLFVVCWGLLRMMFGGVRFAANHNTQRKENKITDVIILQHSRRLLKMDILMFETCCASTCKTDTTKHHPQQTPTHNEKRTR